MREGNTTDRDFLKELQEIIRNNLKDPDFGVSALAREVGMSRSNLHKKVNALAKISVSQFIRQERLQAGLKLLKQTSSTVSEITYEVGFNNVSYFIKCFHEYYGYSPGEVGKREQQVSEAQAETKRKIKPVYIARALITLILVVSAFILYNSKEKGNIPKTVAILPPYYETQDTSYLSVINGTVQNVIDNLNLIKDIERITPWLSVLQYKNSTKPAPEIATELKVNYVVKPSVLSYGGNIHLNFGLIEGLKDNQIWTNSYEIDVNDVTTIYQKISKEIAREINAQITPAEREKIEKRITSNGKALNHYLKGIEFINLWEQEIGTDYSEQAIAEFEKALEYDNECASAYAQLAIIYFLKDYNWLGLNSTDGYEKKFSKQINEYADRALFYDGKLDLSLIAKAFYYQNEGEDEKAVPYLERALVYNPNSVAAYRSLSYLNGRDIFSNPESQLEYALMAMKYDIPDKSNIAKSQEYRDLSHAFRSAGFYNEALEIMKIASELDLSNLANLLENGEIIIESNNDYETVINELLKFPESDSSRLRIHRNLFKNYYKIGKFKESFTYSGSISLKREYFMNIGRKADLMAKMGLKEEAEKYLNFYMTADTNSMGNYIKADFYIRANCLKNKPEKAMESLRELSQQPYFFRETIRNLKDEPLFETIRKLPEFQKIIYEMDSKFWANHERIKKSLEEKGLLNLNL